MSKDEYNIDDILLEAKKLKERAEQGDYPNFEEERKPLGSELEEAINLANNIQDDLSEVIEEETFIRKSKKVEDFSLEIERFEVEEFAKSSRNQVENEKPRLGKNKPVVGSIKRAEFDTEPHLPIKEINKQAKGKKNSGSDYERVNLFDMQLEKRDKPIKAGPFGQKHFSFNKHKDVVEETTFEEDITIEDKSSGFDFDSISDKIEELQNVKNNTEPHEQNSDNPFDTSFKPNSGTNQRDKIKTRYSKIAFGRDKAESSNEATQNIPSESSKNEKNQPDARKSIFSTFATGTGRELKIEDIKKIDFSALEGAGGYYDDEDDVDYFTQEIPDKSLLSFNEYGPKSNRRDVARDIANTKFSIFARTAIITVITIVLFYIAFSARNVNLSLPLFMHPEGNSLSGFILVPIILVGVLIIVCANTTFSGIVSLFKMRANSDTLVTFALIASIMQGISILQNLKDVDIKTVNLIFPVAALTLLFNYISKLGVLGRIQKNFRIVAANRIRKGVSAVQSPAYCKEIMPKITESRPTIAYTSKSDFFSDFLGLSFSTKYDIGINRAVAPVCIIGAIIVAFVTRLLSGNMVAATTALAAVLSICATLSSSFIENTPLSRMAKVLNPMGAMVSGNKAVEDFCDTNAIVLTENELFPKGHVYLNGIKAFPNGRIDEAILDAASVLCALDGSIGYLFLDMIGGNKKLLKKVDNVVYENNMGLSGWVDGRRVLIGNRMLMQNHGVKLPNDSYEKAHPKETPGNPVYVSNSGEVSARFLVEYTVDEELAYQLDQFAAKEKQLIVYTTDANIDANRIWEIYGYPIDLITIMSSELQDGFREMSEPKNDMPAEIVYTGKPASFVAAILAIINVRSAIIAGTIIQLVQIVFGYGMVALMSFMGYLNTFTTMQMVMYQLLWFVIIYAVQKLKKL